MATFHETFYTFTINGPLQQQQNPIKCRSFALSVENNEWKAFCCAKVLDCRVPFARKLIQIWHPPYFQEKGGVTQHVIFYPRQEIFWRYQVFHRKINIFKVARNLVCFICNLFYLKWMNAFKYCYYHPTSWEDLKSYLPFDMTNFTLFDFITKYTSCEWWATIHETRLNNYRLYIFKIYAVPIVFLSYYKCISMCFKRCWYYFLRI